MGKSHRFRFLSPVIPRKIVILYPKISINFYNLFQMQNMHLSQSSIRQRDTQLDIYRALVMIYILCVIHVVYWLSHGSEPLRSIILIEMPIIFFISGASLKGSSKRSFSKTFINRFKRVIIPYYIWIFAAITYVLILITISWFMNWAPPSVNLNGFVLLSYLIYPRDMEGLPYCSHLWFVVPYMIVSCSFPIQRIILERINRNIYFAILIIIFFGSTFLDSLLLQEIFCYNLFFMCGYLYYKQISKKKIALVLTATVVILVVILTTTSISFTPMQKHKFPPDMVFFIFGMGVICLLGLALGQIHLPQLKIIKIWNDKGYSIYLYQNFFFFGLSLILFLFPIIPNRGGIGIVISSIIIFLLATAASFAIVPFERFLVNRLSSYGKRLSEFRRKKDR